MKIAAIGSSMRKGGNTEQIVSLLENNLREKTALAGRELQYEYISLGDLNLSFCRGCRVCFDRGEASCPLKDGLPDLYAILQAADAVIFASPVYVEDVNGVMKNFIDRMAFNCHRPSFAGKTSLIITTSAMGSSNHSVRTMQYAFSSWGFHIAGTKKFRMGALMNKDETAKKYSADAQKLSDALFSAIVNKQAFKPSFYSLLVFRVQQKCYRLDAEYKDTYDYSWWEKQALLDPRTSFYIPHRANPVKTLFARWLSVPIAKIFT